MSDERERMKWEAGGHFLRALALRNGIAQTIDADHKDVESIRRDLRLILDLDRDRETHPDYYTANPLGGPATMFDVIASRIRAGETVAAVLDDYGLEWSKNP